MTNNNNQHFGALLIHQVQVLSNLTIEKVRTALMAAIFDRALFTKVESDGLLEALDIADDAHKRQVRKGATWGQTPIPYIIHPMRVALIIIRWQKFSQLLQQSDPTDTASPPSAFAQAVVAALLHDCVEDSNGRETVGSFYKRFDPEVSATVDRLTKPVNGKDKAKNDRQLNDYFAGIASGSLLVRVVKCADRIDNLFDSLKLNDPAFNQKCLKETQRIYLPVAQDTDFLLHEVMSWVYGVLEVQLNA